MQRVTISLDDDLAQAFDRLIEELLFFFSVNNPTSGAF